MDICASQRSPNAKMCFFSLNTDTLVALTANYNKLPNARSISMKSGLVEIKPVYEARGYS